MPKQASNSEFGKSHFGGGCRSKRVTEQMCCHSVQSRLCAHAFQYLRQADKVALTARRREHPRTIVACWLALDKFHCVGADRPELRAAFGIGEADASCPAINPPPVKCKGLHPAQSRPQQQADGCQRSIVLAGCLGFAHRLSEPGEFI